MPKKVRIELDYDIGDLVFLKTDPDYYERMVISITLLPNNLAIYSLSCGSEEVSDHYAIEILDKKPVD